LPLLDAAGFNRASFDLAAASGRLLEETDMKRLLSTIIGLLLAAVSGVAAAAPILYSADLGGAAENPANASPGTGKAIVTYDPQAHTLKVHVDFSDLLAPVTVAHIHCCVAAPGNVGVATYPGTFPGFPAGVTSGTYDFVVDLTLTSSYTAGFLNNFGGGTAAGAELALAGGLNAGQAYFNIHTSQFPGGEIRGFLQVPEPQSLALAGMALLALFVVRIPRRRQQLA
jgi:hypothetical protein